jgi:predicted amidophosphoribosyltransferase
MPTVAELTALYGNFMLSPRRGPGVCRRCLNLTDGYDCCYACTHIEPWLDAVSPISYSVANEQLHHALAGYKRPPDVVAERFRLELAAVLWRHLAKHESCLAQAVGIQAFDLVTPVPSSTPERGQTHPLHQIVGELIGVTRGRYERLLRRSPIPVEPRTFSTDKYAATSALPGRSVLLIDDTWTTGANAQSAAATLKCAGAGPVAAVVIGRHVNREWHQNDQRLRRLATPFDWGRCVICAPEEDQRTQ